MRNSLFLFLGLAALHIISCNNNQEVKSKNKFSDAEMVRIYELADQRNTTGIIPYLKSENAAYREAAALSFASIQDVSAIDALSQQLTDPSADVRTAVAYSLGQINSPAALPGLIFAFTDEKDDLVRAQLLESIGKLTAANFIQPIEDSYTEQGTRLLRDLDIRTESERLGWSKAVLWLNMASMTDPQLMDRMPYILQKSEHESRLACAFAMARFKNEDWFKAEKNKTYVINWCKAERSSDVRIPQMAMLPKIGNEEAAALLIGYLQSTSQEDAVRIAALRAAAKVSSIKADDLMPVLDAPEEAILIDCLAALEKKDTKLLGNEIFEKCKDRSAQIVSAAIRIWYKTNPTDAAAEMWKRYSDATTIYDKVHYAHALGVNPNLASGCVEAISTSKEYPVKNALTEALIEMHTSTNWPNNLDFNTTATSLILDGDIGVQALLAGHFRELKFNETEKQPIITALTEALGKLSLPREIETYNEIIKTLNVLSDQKREEKKVEFNHPIDWKEVSGISSKQVAKITTSKGVIQMELRVNDAPGSVSNFVKLAKEGFYNDKYFHRVISNFVIQGGCPRGDGMGSTDYTIRSEFALHNYSEGAVGLASSGRDTESCQWFITHGYTPHLEGRYTIFAYVTSGMEVVKKIQIGDQILKVEIIE